MAEFLVYATVQEERFWGIYVADTAVEAERMACEDNYTGDVVQVIVRPVAEAPNERG